MPTEAELTQSITADIKEICGGSSLESKAIVKAIATHLRQDPSEAFVSLADQYRIELSYNAECASSQKFSQRIRAAIIRNDGVYFLEDAWGKAVESWLEDNPAEQPLMEALDDLYSAAGEGKPTKKWLKQSDELLASFPDQQALTTVRTIVDLLLHAKEAKKYGIKGDNERKLRVMVLFLSLYTSAAEADFWKALTILCYDKIPYVGPVSRHSII